MSAVHLFLLVCISELLDSSSCYIPKLKHPDPVSGSVSKSPPTGTLLINISKRSWNSTSLPRETATSTRPEKPTSTFRTYSATSLRTSVRPLQKLIVENHRINNGHVNTEAKKDSGKLHATISDNSETTTKPLAANTYKPQDDKQSNIIQAPNQNESSNTTTNSIASTASDTTSTSLGSDKDDEAEATIETKYPEFMYESTLEVDISESTSHYNIRKQTSTGVSRSSQRRRFTTTAAFWSQIMASFNESVELSSPDSNATLNPLMQSTNFNASNCMPTGVCLEERNVCARCRWWELFCWAHCGWVGAECAGRYAFCSVFGR